MNHNIYFPNQEETRIQKKLRESVIITSRILHQANLKKHESDQLIALLDNIKSVSTYCQEPSLTYLGIKNILDKDLNGSLELDGVNILLSVVDKPCNSRITNYTIKLK